IYITGPGGLLHLVHHGPFPTEPVLADVGALTPVEGEFYRVLILYNDGEDTIGRSGLFSFGNQMMVIDPDLVETMLSSRFYLFSIDLSDTEVSAGTYIETTINGSPPESVEPESLRIAMYSTEDNRAVQVKRLSSLTLNTPEPWLASNRGSFVFRIYAQGAGDTLGESLPFTISGGEMVGEIVSPVDGSTLFADDSFTVRLSLNHHAQMGLQSIKLYLEDPETHQLIYDGAYEASGSFMVSMDFAGEDFGLLNRNLSLIAVGEYDCPSCETGTESLRLDDIQVKFSGGFAMDPELILDFVESNTPHIDYVSCRQGSASWGPCTVLDQSRDVYDVKVDGNALGHETGRLYLIWRAGGRSRMVQPTILHWSNEEVRFQFPTNFDADDHQEYIGVQ
ncbi:MAG: hypothetical protein D6B25_09980, partial [Desulfobulbaceae bacterium]